MLLDVTLQARAISKALHHSSVVTALQTQTAAAVPAGRPAVHAQQRSKGEPKVIGLETAEVNSLTL